MKQQNKNSGKVNILVTVRCRPLSKKESDLSSVESVKILNGNVVHITDEINSNNNNKNKKNQIRDQQFYYDFAFDKNTSQKDVYENSTKFLISNVLNGYNATVFAYGATGSGKTYTMIGTDTNPGIMPRCVIDIFNYINKNLSNNKYEININFFEIYNENIRDLLSNNNNNLEIREEPAKGIVINNITNIEIKDTSTFFENILKGNNNRTTESTNSNETSSRSHAILQINLNYKDLEKNEKFRSKFMLVDLAGSERQNSYLNSTNKNNNATAAMRQMEGSNINKSLLALGICINALIDKKKSFIPWRNSKLTRILKESLIGNSRIVMISTISPSLFSIDETVNTLLFANRAKNVQTIVKKNIISNNNNLKDKNEADMEYQINKYDEIISNLNNELENLRHNLAVKTHNHHLLRNDFSNNNVNSKVDKITREITTHFNDEIRMKNEIIDIQKNIDMLIEKYHEKEFSLFKIINNNNNLTNEKIIRSSLNKINEQINLQKGLLINKENSYNELIKKREYFENVINKISNNNNNNNLNNLQYLFHSFVFEVNNIENEFIRKQNLNQIRQKNMKIQKLVEQLKIRDEYINNEKKEIENKNINFVFENENDIKKIEDLNIDKSFSLPVIVQNNDNLNTNNFRLSAKSTKRNFNDDNKNESPPQRIFKYDYSGYNNPNIVKEKQNFKTKTNEIIKKSKKNQLSELKLNILNDLYKNSKVKYINYKKNLKKSYDDDNVITFDTRILNKSQSNVSLHSNKSFSDLNNSRYFKEREIDNKIKKIMVGKKIINPYFNKQS